MLLNSQFSWSGLVVSILKNESFNLGMTFRKSFPGVLSKKSVGDCHCEISKLVRRDVLIRGRYVTRRGTGSGAGFSFSS